MTEARLVTHCQKLGHDVERVVPVGDLGSGSDDAATVAYADRESRVLVTYDDDFLSHKALDRIGVLSQPDDRTPPFEIVNIIHAISQHVSSEQLVESEDPFHLTAAWL